MLKKCWYLLAVSGVSLIIIAGMLHSPWLTEFVVGRFLVAKPGLVLRHVHFGQQRFSLPGRLQLQKVDLVCEVNGTLLSVEAPEVVVTGLQTFWSSDRRIRVVAQHIGLRYPPGQIKEAKIDLTIDPQGVSGPFTAAQAGWDKLSVTDVAAFVIVNASGIEGRAVKLAAYGGKITGKVFVHASSGKDAGVYAVEFFTEGLDVSRLADVNPGITAQLNGMLTGTVKLEGDARALRAMEADLAMPAGGKVSASLLAVLMQYLPQSIEKKRLDVLVRKGGKIVMEAFSFTMKGGQAGKFSGDVRLRSREVNLELNVTHEIKTDGTIDSFLGYMQRFIK